MGFIKNLIGSLVIGVILAGVVIIFDAEARKDALGVIAVSMILAPTAVTFIWIFKKYPKPGIQFLMLFGLLAVSVLLAILCDYFGWEKLAGIFGIGVIASVLLILTWVFFWILGFASRAKITGGDKDNMST